jgi:polyisoprenyl-teichoic acid--peptidoglycan teichoic acid transferase
VTVVSGKRRVAVPPARMRPFIAGMVAGANVADSSPCRDRGLTGVSRPGARLPGVLLGQRRPIAIPSRSPALATFLSFLWPGLGQWYAGRPRSAALYGLPVLVALLAVGSQALGGVDALAADLITPTVALTILILIALLGAWRVLAMADALARTGVKGSWRHGLAMPTFAGLIVVTVAVHGLAGYYAWSFYDAGRQIFVGSSVDGAPQPTQASPTPSPTDVAAVLSATPFATPATTSSRINILLTGIDNGLANRTESLTDTMLIVSIDPATSQIDMISFPRDISQFQLYNGGTFAGKLNSLMSYAYGHPKQFPEGGFVALEKELGFLLGVPIHYFAAINLAGFQQMISVVGGVNVVNPKVINDPTYDWFNGTHGFYLPAGPVHLDAAHALAYVRSRKGVGDSDFTRAARQQQLLVALRAKITQPSMLGRIPALLRAAANTIRTNFPSDRIAEMLALAKTVNDKTIQKFVLGPPYSYNPPLNTTNGTYILRMYMNKIEALSVRLFGSDSAYYTAPATGSTSTPTPTP